MRQCPASEYWSLRSHPYRDAFLNSDSQRFSIALQVLWFSCGKGLRNRYLRADSVDSWAKSMKNIGILPGNRDFFNPEC